MWLARKISYSRWATTQGFEIDELPADHVAKGLKTKGNTLSFWAAPGPAREEVQDAALALILSLNRLDAIDVAWVSKGALESDGIVLSPTPGKTKLTDRADTHYDAVGLDVRRLGTVAAHLALAVRRDERVWKITKREAIKLVACAIDDKRIGLSNLPTAWRDEVSAHTRI